MSGTSELEEPLIPDKQEKEIPKVSRNVYVTFVLLIFWGLADSIWAGAVLSAWLFLLAGGDPNPEEDHNNMFLVMMSAATLLRIGTHYKFVRPGREANTLVGGVEALQGVAGLLTALPIGYLADKYGKAIMCKVGGVGFVFSAFLTLLAILGHWNNNTEVILLGIALVLWGIFGGVYSGPVQALFADSVPSGDRSYYYTILQNCYIGPSIVGPIVAIVLFKLYGDDWTIEELRLPFIIGIIFEIPTAVLSFLLSDDLTVPEEEDELPGEATGLTEEDKMAGKRDSYRVPIFGIKLTRNSIPYVLFFSDVLYALGSGMTIKFVPLFFAKEIGLTPSGVQAVTIFTSILLMMASFLAQRASVKLGRVQVVVLCRASGICFLVLLSRLVSYGIRSWYIIVPIYLIRAGLMNCCYPLDESILMDNVKKNERARWKSLESITVAGWCGSAFIGGILADKYSYDISFLMTAALQGLGCLAYTTLIPLVLDEKTRTVRKEESKEGVEQKQ